MVKTSSRGVKTWRDWHSIADAHPGWLYSDGIHLPAAGAAHYAQIVMAAALGS